MSRLEQGSPFIPRTPGIYGIPFCDYAAIDAVNNTALGKMNPPAEYKAWVDAGRTEDETEAMRIGRYAHCAVMEPDRFAADIEKFAPRPKGMKFNTAEGRAWKAEQVAAGKEVIEAEDREFFRCAPQVIAAHPMASQMFASGKTEQSIIGDYNGIPLKARLDIISDWTKGGNNITDLKTTESADPEDFYWKKIIGMRIYRQGAFYLDICKSVGIPMEHFTIIAIEKRRPFLISCHQLSAKLIQKGRDEYIALLGKYAECKSSGIWPGYEPVLHQAPSPEDWKRVKDPDWLTEAA